MPRNSITALRDRLYTLRQLLAHFAHRKRFMLIPLLVVLLLGALLLVLTEGIGFLAPFVYTLF